MGEVKRVSVFTQGASHLNEASYRICHSLAQHQVPFTHAEVFKKAFMVGAEVMFAGFLTKQKIIEHISKLPLSADACVRRCDDLSGDDFKQLLSKLRACPAWSIALNGITDGSDIAQLLVSVRYFDNGVSEDILCLIPLKGTTTAADISNALLQFRQENELKCDNLVSMCTDGALCLVVEPDSLRCSVSKLESQTCFLIIALFITKLYAQKEAAACRKQCKLLLKL